MTTQPNTCTRCGKTLYDGIHTCSPQVANTNDADRDAFLTWHRDRFGYTSISAEEVGESSKLFVCWQAALLHARKNVPEWISVDERFPEDRQEVNFVVDCRNPNWNYLHGRVLGGRFIKDQGFGIPGLTISASHWTPSPLPPEKE